MSQCDFSFQTNPYTTILQLSIPRLLSLQDRNPLSTTYGCFDRPYWHFKTITDFPNISCQQSMLVLAQIYKYPFSGNIYFGKKKILENIIAGLTFWAKSQHKDGSVDEFFPYDRSFCAIAFTTYAAAESLSLIKDEIELSCFEELQKKVHSSCNWILKHDNKEVTNQILAASVALLKSFFLTQDHRYLVGSQEKLKRALSQQNEEGWFYEYNGADIGYLSISIDLLVHHYKFSADEKVKQAALRAIGFLKHFIFPHGSAGGEYGSRNTQYIMPSGLEFFSNYSDEAQYILHYLYRGFQKGQTLSPLSSDDRYFCFFYIPSYVSALYLFKPKNYTHRPLSDGMTLFKRAGLVHYKNQDMHVVIGASKNGVIKISNQDKTVYSEVGFFCTLKNGHLVASQFLNTQNSFSVSEINQDIIIKIQGQFIRVYNKIPMRKYLLPFRIFNYVFLRFKLFHQLFDLFFRKKMIMKKTKTKIYFNKKIRLNSEGIEIEDEITGSYLRKIQKMYLLSHGTAMYNTTSSCFQNCEIDDSHLHQEIDLDCLQNNKQIRLSRKIIFKQLDNPSVMRGRQGRSEKGDAGVLFCTSRSLTSENEVFPHN
ncbi:MAG: hypothetical protein HYS98_05875 [Deltaproteobacteria bacterium]|nr:hypothetical protein [Deltaproteobacteria bacterium]